MVYVGDLETVATTGSTTTTTTYYYAAGQRIALAVNGTLSYLASDLLGSATVALTASGLPTASQLYAPDGTVRYQNGTMPTGYGFTGQRADSTTGLDYYGARYYDPALGQFTSADTVQDGLNRYNYVDGNPISRTDPSGHMLCSDVTSSMCEGIPPPPWGIHDHPVKIKKCMVHCSGSGNGNSTDGSGNDSNNPATFSSGNGGRGLPVEYERAVLDFDNWWFAGYGAYVGFAQGYNARFLKLLKADAWDSYTYINKRGRPVDVRFKVRTTDGTPTTVGTPDEIAAIETKLRFGVKFGRVLAGIGFVLDGVLSGLDYADAHQSDPNVAIKTAGYAALHATIVTGTSIVFAWAFGVAFGAIGGTLGTFALPLVGTVSGGALGAGIGGALGGFVGGMVGGSLADAILPRFFG